MSPSIRKFHIGDRTISMETGRIARQATSAILVREGDTVILVTVTAATKPREGIVFFPLTVEYREKLASTGRIPGNFMRREGRITDHEVLCSRLIDRSIRPLFPKGYRNEIQVQASVFSAGPGSDPAPLAILGVGAALHLSPIPWEGPVGGLRINRLEDRLVVLPNPLERIKSQAELMVSVGPTGLVMVEGEARELPEEGALEMLFTAADELAPFLTEVREWRDELGGEKWEFTPPTTDQELQSKLATAYTEKIKLGLAIPGKQKRHTALAAIKKEALADLADPDKEETDRTAAAITALETSILRKAIAEEGRRPDGRDPEEIRPIWCEAGWLPGPHGSAIFTRGETQALATCTLGNSKNSQLVEDLQGINHVTFMLHYNFPPYSVGEVRPLRGPGRREIGHGFLAKKALLGVLPEYEEFPYVIRLESEISESNGSSSMATVCGGCLALFDAGVPMKSAVAGIAMGLIQEGDKTVILSDILGDEDHLGDMDFKVTGTNNGITALQMDNKIGGLSREVMAAALAQAKRGREHILKVMGKILERPREELADHAPRASTLRIRPECIGMLIGPKGQTIKKIQEESGADVSVDDSGLVSIYATGGTAARRAKQMIRAAAGDVQKGRVYLAKVVAVKDFGAFVAIYPHVEGLVHASQWDEREVESMHQTTFAGEEVLVRVIGADEKGRLVLSRKEALGTDPADAAN